MDLIDIPAPSSERRCIFFARSAGTSFDVRAAKDEADKPVTEIDLYDEIGFWGVNAREFRSRLKDAGDVVLRVNSPGGDVFDGLAMYNDLLRHRGSVRVEITGMAASIASIIAMAGDEIVMAPNSFFMIHNAWTIGIGNRHDFSDISGVLTKIDDALARTYAARTKTGIRDIKRMMDNETWMTAKEAVDGGFAKSIADGAGGAQAKFDLSVFSAPPEVLQWSDDTSEEPETERDWERVAMRDAGWTRSKVRAFKRALKSADEATNDKPLQDAGEVDLTQIAVALKEARSALTT